MKAADRALERRAFAAWKNWKLAPNAGVLRSKAASVVYGAYGYPHDVEPAEAFVAGYLAATSAHRRASTKKKPPRNHPPGRGKGRR